MTCTQKSQRGVIGQSSRSYQPCVDEGVSLVHSYTSRKNNNIPHILHRVNQEEHTYRICVLQYTLCQSRQPLAKTQRKQTKDDMEVFIVCVICALVAFEMAECASQLLCGFQGMKVEGRWLTHTVDNVRCWSSRKRRAVCGSVVSQIPERRVSPYSNDIESGSPVLGFAVETKGEKEKLDSGVQRQSSQLEPQHDDDTARLRCVSVWTRLLILSPICMVAMSNYAVTRGLQTGCYSRRIHALEVS